MALRNNLSAFLFTALSCAVVLLSSGTARGEWTGVDETVVEKFAEEAGRAPRDPYINTDKGDMLLFVFLVAGAVGGFVAGYYFRGLFGIKKEGQN